MNAITTNNGSTVGAALAAQTKVSTPPNYIYPVIAVVGQSGTGKTTSIEQLPPEQTCIINIERKPLPFPGKLKFNELRPTTAPEIENVVKVALANTAYKYIVIDSFTKYCELLMQTCRSAFKGYDIFTQYNDHVFTFLETIKNCNHAFVIITAIDEMVMIEQPNGARVSQRRIAVEGKKWEGKVEKEFTCVLYTDVRKLNNNIVYQFQTNNDGVSQAKSPRGLFTQLYIPNDLNAVCKEYMKFDGLI